MAKIVLPNGCMRSEIKVSPKNWNDPKASSKNLLKKNWRIYYRYYDPAYKGTKQWGKIVEIKSGINRIKDLQQRRQATKAVIEDEQYHLDVQGFNPITGTYVNPDTAVEEISTEATFIEALRQALKLQSGVKGTIADMKSAVRGIERAAGKLYDKTLLKPYSALKISEVGRKHLTYLLQQCGKDNKRFSDKRYNRYRTYLVMLFNILMRVQAVDTNPAAGLPMKNVIKEKREVLTEAEQVIVDTNLKTRDYYYWRYMRIFHRSGSRSTEMLRLKYEKVDLEKQEFKVILLKGGLYMEDVRAIPDDILPLWREVVAECRPGQYLFSLGFRPGDVQIGRDNVDKRWRKYVKKEMGIAKDFYSLKHLNADQLDEQEGIEIAAAAAGHMDTSMMLKHYAVNHKKRTVNRLKNTTVPFGKKSAEDCSTDVRPIIYN